MATSSRKSAIELWQTNIPEGNKEKLAHTLFCFENPPGKKYISGSQDSLGIVMPGLNRFYYENDYWPAKIDSVLDEDILNWIEERIQIVPLTPRETGFDVLANTNINTIDAKRLSEAADNCWNSLLKKKPADVGKAMTASFEAQIAMFPNMVTPEILSHLKQYKSDALGWKLSGAGGGGYFIFFSEKPIENAFSIRIRKS